MGAPERVLGLFEAEAMPAAIKAFERCSFRFSNGFQGHPEKALGPLFGKLRRGHRSFSKKKGGGQKPKALELGDLPMDRRDPSRV
jgi:hypothetical protein